MTREDIIKLAREARMEQDGDNFFSPGHEEIDVHITDLERFAQLVAAAEREACAKVCEERCTGQGLPFVMAAANCAEAIRARGTA
jgi:hypothetical protein